MASRKYDKLNIEDFGKQLLATGDLDPIYIALEKMSEKGQLPETQKHRWLLAYWCFYSAGLACYLSELEGEAYWAKFMTAASNSPNDPCPVAIPNGVNGGWPRAKERRHFRGLSCVKAVRELQEKYPQPENAILHLVRQDDPTPLPYRTVKARVKEWHLFGDWIAYKVGDMLDRCGVARIGFAFDDAMYDTPREAALMRWRIKHGIPLGDAGVVDNPTAAVREIVEYLLTYFGDIKAPPFFDRPVGLQEIETILCKWKSHLGGHYPLKNDLHEIGEGLTHWVSWGNKTALDFMDAMPSL